jgi:hypothetical protein
LTCGEIDSISASDRAQRRYSFFLGLATAGVVNAHASPVEPRKANRPFELFPIQSKILNFQQQAECEIDFIQPAEISFCVNRISSDQAIVCPPGRNIRHPTRTGLAGTSLERAIYSNSDKSIDRHIAGLSLAKVCDVPSPYNFALVSKGWHKLRRDDFVSYRQIGLLALSWPRITVSCQTEKSAKAPVKVATKKLNLSLGVFHHWGRRWYQTFSAFTFSRCFAFLRASRSSFCRLYSCLSMIGTNSRSHFT